MRVQQTPSGMPCHRYAAFRPVDLPDRTWPGKTITTAPVSYTHLTLPTTERV